MTVRKLTQEIEEKTLSRYAALSSQTKGRQYFEEECNIRTPYQRDRDRIIHDPFFRKLKYKTQAFIVKEGSSYRTRLTHTLEVAQIARTISRALRLNEDLTEAIALGHDLGHAPFGHTGERALFEICPFPFYHNEQSLRVVDVLAKKGQGLNLTWEVRDGILNHTVKGNPATLEGKVVQVSDRIAYVNHDIDDAINAKILKKSQLPKDALSLLGNTGSERIDTLVTSVIENSYDDIKIAPDISEAFDRLREFMFNEVYEIAISKQEESKVHKFIKNLYSHYKEHPQQLPDLYQEIYEREGIDRAVCDYISEMTECTAIKLFASTFSFNWCIGE